MNKANKDRLVKNLEELKLNATQSCGVEVYISLGGFIRSSKQIWHRRKHFTIMNFVDGSIQYLSKAQLMNKDFTNIGEALKKKCLYYD